MRQHTFCIEVNEGQRSHAKRNVQTQVKSAVHVSSCEREQPSSHSTLLLSRHPCLLLSSLAIGGEGGEVVPTPIAV